MGTRVCRHNLVHYFLIIAVRSLLFRARVRLVLNALYDEPLYH